MLRRIQGISLMEAIHFLKPININLFLYRAPQALQPCPHTLKGPMSLERFSFRNKSGTRRIDQRLTHHREVYVARFGDEIVHECWVHYDTLLPSQFGFDVTVPVIGDGVTDPRYRGKRILPFVLNHIVDDIRARKKCRDAYALISPYNESSIRAVERIGYVRLAHLKGKRIGIFILNKTVDKVVPGLT